MTWATWSMDTSCFTSSVGQIDLMICCSSKNIADIRLPHAFRHPFWWEQKLTKTFYHHAPGMVVALAAAGARCVSCASCKALPR